MFESRVSQLVFALLCFHRDGFRASEVPVKKALLEDRGKYPVKKYMGHPLAKGNFAHTKISYAACLLQSKTEFFPPPC